MFLYKYKKHVVSCKQHVIESYILFTLPVFIFLLVYLNNSHLKWLLIEVD